MTPEQIKELDGPIWRLINAYINHCELEGDTDPDDALIHAARVELRDLVACHNTAHNLARRMVRIREMLAKELERVDQLGMKEFSESYPNAKFKISVSIASARELSELLTWREG